MVPRWTKDGFDIFATHALPDAVAVLLCDGVWPGPQCDRPDGDRCQHQSDQYPSQLAAPHVTLPRHGCDLTDYSVIRSVTSFRGIGWQGNSTGLPLPSFS